MREAGEGLRTKIEKESKPDGNKRECRMMREAGEALRTKKGMESRRFAEAAHQVMRLFTEAARRETQNKRERQKEQMRATVGVLLPPGTGPHPRD